MNKLTRFVRYELNGWNKGEVIVFFVILLGVLFNKLVFHDSIIAVISAFCGIMYTLFAGKGKMSCYLFGLTGSGFYAYLAFSQSFWGNMMLNLLYYVPMQILGIFRWKSNLKPETLEIYKTSLTKKERIVLFTLAFVVSGMFYYILRLNGDSKPMFDSITTVFSVLGMYLTVRRAIEQWVVWSIVNFICVVMWLGVLLGGVKVYSTVFMWLSYFFLGIYFYFKWDRELATSSCR